MPRIDVNRSGEMEAFVQVVDRGSFSAGARVLGMTPSAVSKLIARLEARLATQLVHRSTRKLQLTPEGRNIVLTDRVVDLMDERTDIAIRWGQLPPSDLVARRLFDTGQAIVASPAYLARYGTPRTPQELEAHNRIGSTYRRSTPDWPFSIDGRLIAMPVVGSARAGDGDTLRQLVLAGVGLGRLSLYHIQPDIDAGRLVPVLEEFNPREMEPIHAVYLGKAGRLPARVRALLDYLSAQLADNSHS